MSYYVEMANEALAEYEAQRGPDRAIGHAAVDLLNRSAVRMTTHRGQRVIALPAANDTPEVRQALEALGYGGCIVVHLDTTAHKGQSASSIAAAIEGGDE